MIKERYDYIDIAKGIGILMVVWAHIIVTGWTHKMIYAFHMPLFFFLSGMLFKPNKYNSFGAFFIRRAKRLLIPYFIFSIVTWIVWAAFRFLRNDEVESYLMPLIQTFIAQGSGEFMVHNSALWFIPCLFLVEILYFFICKFGKIWSLVICCALTAASFILGQVFGSEFWLTPFWNADAAFIALPFYCIGNIITTTIGHNNISYKISYYKWQFIISVIVMTILLYWASISFGECSMGSSSYQCNGLIFVLRAFLGCAWLIILSILISNIKLKNSFCSIPISYFKWAGAKSLDIMCLHIPIKGICMIVVAIALHTTVDDVGNIMFYALIAFILTMTMCWLTIRFVVNNVSKLKIRFNK